jgi:hypothetical protein
LSASRSRLHGLLSLRQAPRGGDLCKPPRVSRTRVRSAACPDAAATFVSFTSSAGAPITAAKAHENERSITRVVIGAGAFGRNRVRTRGRRSRGV